MAESSVQTESGTSKLRSIKVREAVLSSNRSGSREPSPLAASNIPDRDAPSEEQTFSYLNGLYAFVILVANIAWVSTYTLIPWRDVFVHQSAWWESLIRTVILLFLRVTLCTIREAYVVFKMESLMTVKYHVKFLMVLSLTYSVPYCGSYYYWTILSGMNHPIPWILVPCFYLSNFVAFASLWFHFPKELRLDKKFGKRLKSYIYYLLLWNLIAFAEITMDTIFVELTNYENNSGMEVQWLMALVIPLFRGLFEWLLPKFFHKALGYKEGWTKLDEDEAATFAMETQIADVFALYVAVRLGWAKQSTVLCILVVEFTINLFYCLRIIKLHNKIGENNNNQDNQTKIWKAEKDSAVISLITVETIEVLIPLGYSMAYATAYYGPNATLFGGVKATYVGYTEVTDIGSVFTFLFTMFAADTLGGILISALLVWKCKINVIKEYCKVMQKYWIILLLYTSSDLLYVRNLESFLISLQYFLHSQKSLSSSQSFFSNLATHSSAKELTTLSNSNG